MSLMVRYLLKSNAIKASLALNTSPSEINVTLYELLISSFVESTNFIFRWIHRLTSPKLVVLDNIIHLLTLSKN